MKRSALLLLCMGLFFVSFRLEEPTGINFFRGSWQDVVAESKRQNKPIYVDFYTTWCPPCRRMAIEAFPNVAIGTKFNKNFISYQVNAEVGEGVTLAKRYAVQSYPTTLYLLPTGEVVHRAVGYAGVNAMLKQADMILAMREVRRSKRSLARKRSPTNEVNMPVLSNQFDSTKVNHSYD